MGYKERSLRKRKADLRLRERYARRGKEFVYIDESGFDPSVTRRYAYAPRGERVYGLRSGHRRPRTSLLAARFLPPYSPDLNPIEHDFSTIKRIRGYREHATLDSIIRAYK